MGVSLVHEVPNDFEVVAHHSHVVHSYGHRPAACQDKPAVAAQAAQGRECRARSWPDADDYACHHLAGQEPCKRLELAEGARFVDGRELQLGMSRIRAPSSIPVELA